MPKKIDKHGWNAWFDLFGNLCDQLVKEDVGSMAKVSVQTLER